MDEFLIRVQSKCSFISWNQQLFRHVRSCKLRIIFEPIIHYIFIFLTRAKVVLWLLLYVATSSSLVGSVDQQTLDCSILLHAGNYITHDFFSDCSPSVNENYGLGSAIPSLSLLPPVVQEHEPSLCWITAFRLTRALRYHLRVYASPTVLIA